MAGFRVKAYGNSPDVFEESWGKFDGTLTVHLIIVTITLFCGLICCACTPVKDAHIEFLLFEWIYARALHGSGPIATILVSASTSTTDSNTANHR